MKYEILQNGSVIAEADSTFAAEDIAEAMNKTFPQVEFTFREMNTSRFTLTTYDFSPAILDTYTGKLAPFWTVATAEQYLSALNSDHSLTYSTLWV